MISDEYRHRLNQILWELVFHIHMGRYRIWNPSHQAANAVTDRKDDASAAVQAAIANVVGLGWSSGGGGLIQTTFG